MKTHKHTRIVQIKNKKNDISHRYSCMYYVS